MSGLTFTGDLVVYLLGLAVVWGSLLQRVNVLEKKMDRHNNLVERMVAVETRIENMERETE